MNALKSRNFYEIPCILNLESTFFCWWNREQILCQTNQDVWKTQSQMTEVFNLLFPVLLPKWLLCCPPFSLQCCERQILLQHPQNTEQRVALPCLSIWTSPLFILGGTCAEQRCRAEWTDLRHPACPLLFSRVHVAARKQRLGLGTQLSVLFWFSGIC